MAGIGVSIVGKCGSSITGDTVKMTSTRTNRRRITELGAVLITGLCPILLANGLHHLWFATNSTMTKQGLAITTLGLIFAAVLVKILLLDRRQRLKFAAKYEQPIVDGEKTATIRYELEDDIRINDKLEAVTPTGSRIATIQITHLETTPVKDAHTILYSHNLKHGTSTISELVDGLNEHYDDEITQSTPVTTVGFTVVTT